MVMNNGTMVRRREIILALFAAALLACLIALFFMPIAGSAFFWVLGILAALVVLGLFQYVLWGHRLEDELPTAGPPGPAVPPRRRL
jgi:high-affinity Fe2+/Pb2+ permease